MKHLLFAVCIVCAASSITAQDLSGTWQGMADVMGQKLKAVFHIVKTNGQYIVTFDSPDQGAMGYHCDGLVMTGDSVHIKMKVIAGGYNGKWNGANEITGALSQGSKSFMLTLQKATGENAAPVVKPQTPKPPFNYDSEEVEYDNADKSVHYGATLTKPRNTKSFPTVIIISGSGSQDRDFSYRGHKFYAVLADYLTTHGIAVLRVDDRGVGKSTVGNDVTMVNLTSETFSWDVETSLNYLQSRKDIDGKKIGLIGHSEGGIIAPMVAARRKDVAFVVLWAGPIIGGLQTNVEQNAHSLLQNGIDSAAVKAFSQLHSAVLSVFATTGMNELDGKINTIFSKWKQEQPKEILTKLYVTDNSVVGQEIHKMYHSLYDLAWMRYFIMYNPSTDLAKVKCPVLAINGTKDMQVDAKENLARINDILLKSGNKNFKVVPLSSLNHLLQTANTGDVAEYGTIEESISSAALSLIAGWIKENVK